MNRYVLSWGGVFMAFFGFTLPTTTLCAPLMAVGLGLMIMGLAVKEPKSDEKWYNVLPPNGLTKPDPDPAPTKRSDETQVEFLRRLSKWSKDHEKAP